MRNSGHLRWTLGLSAFLMYNITISHGISCKDENNRDVDWFINYKLPKIAKEKVGSFLNAGKAYAYITSESLTNWNLSSISIESPTSMLGRTWQDFANKRKSTDVSYLFYNDDPPGKHESNAVGHLKGIVAFDGRTGFWLMHSIPRFGDRLKYEYPKTALVNGQMAFCMTFNTKTLNEICNHLLYCHPNVYERRLTASMRNYLDTKAKSMFSKRPTFSRKPPFMKVSTLKSLKNQLFYGFAKDNQLKQDIYSNIIAPHLETSLFAATWGRGAGTALAPYCESEYAVTDIISLRMTTSNREEGIDFKSTEDHSKWAISMESSSNWVCIGDLNRMQSQARRGGGAVCFQSKPVWKAFQSLIYESALCPTK